MMHDNPDFAQKLRLALTETDTGPTAETLINAPLLDRWFYVSQNGFPSFCGRISQANTPANSNQTWSRTSVVLGLDRNGTWARTLNRFYRLSPQPCPSIPEFEAGFGKLALHRLQAVSVNEFSGLIDAFARRAKWYLRQIN